MKIESCNGVCIFIELNNDDATIIKIWPANGTAILLSDQLIKLTNVVSHIARFKQLPSDERLSWRESVVKEMEELCSSQ